MPMNLLPILGSADQSSKAKSQWHKKETIRRIFIYISLLIILPNLVRDRRQES